MTDTQLPALENSMQPILAQRGEQGCGDCTVCCKVLQVNDTPVCVKQAGQPCPWLHKGPYHGCSIYKERPDSCRSFECLYIKLARRPDLPTSTDLRPDKSGVMFVHQPNRVFFIAHNYDPQRMEAYKDPEPWAVIERLCQEGFKVIVTWGPSPKKILFERDGRGGIKETHITMGAPNEEGEQQAHYPTS